MIDNAMVMFYVIRKGGAFYAANLVCQRNRCIHHQFTSRVLHLWDYKTPEQISCNYEQPVKDSSFRWQVESSINSVAVKLNRMCHTWRGSEPQFTVRHIPHLLNSKSDACLPISPSDTEGFEEAQARSCSNDPDSIRVAHTVLLCSFSVWSPVT